MNLPFKEVEFNDKHIFDKYLNSTYIETGELTFTNILSWRNFYNAQYVEIGKTLCILADTPDDDLFMLPPIGPVTEEVINALKEHFATMQKQLVFRRVSANTTDRLKQLYPNVEVIPDRNNWDYVYSVEKMATFPGKKYHKKRNHVSWFTNNFQPIIEQITPDNKSKCLQLLDEWANSKSNGDVDISFEYAAQKDIIENFEKYNIDGIIVDLDGKGVAYTMGEQLNDDTVIVHVEKADHNIRGLYQFITKAYCETKLNKYKWVNREQDLGIEGLRLAKASYYPEKMIEKNIVKFLSK